MQRQHRPNSKHAPSLPRSGSFSLYRRGSCQMLPLFDLWPCTDIKGLENQKLRACGLFYVRTLPEFSLSPLSDVLFLICCIVRAFQCREKARPGTPFPLRRMRLRKREALIQSTSRRRPFRLLCTHTYAWAERCTRAPFQYITFTYVCIYPFVTIRFCCPAHLLPFFAGTGEQG